MEAERREEQRKSWSSRGHFRGGMEGGGGCNCPECRFREALFGSFFGGGRSPEFFFEQFGEDDDSDDWDRRYDEEEDYAREEEDQKAADLIGVDVDAEPDAIKKEYRKLALKYHPDKYRFEKHEDTGMNKDEATEHFKKVQNAYDHLMSNFDD
jgi:DnaJ domain